MNWKMYIGIFFTSAAMGALADFAYGKYGQYYARKLAGK